MQGESVAQFLDYRDSLQSRIGDIPLVTGTEATIKALNMVGARRLAAISPMSDDHSRRVADFYEDLGFEVPYHAGLQVARSEDIIKIGIDEARDAFRRLDHDDVDTFLHVGGALGIAAGVAELEAEFDRPVVSINIASYWCALRTLGVNEPLVGYGKLARKPAIRSHDLTCMSLL